MFLGQLISTLEAEDKGRMAESVRISGSSGGRRDASGASVMGASATAHGKKLLELGYSVDQVVHDYGDICQSITDLAVERSEPFSVEDFRTLNRCLDNSIADAVTEFSAGRDASLALKQFADENERRGILAHELRNHAQTATMAFGTLESGQLAVGGSTGALLKRSLDSIARLLKSSLAEVRLAAQGTGDGPEFSLAAFIADAASDASLDAARRGCQLSVATVDPFLTIAGDRDRLLGALANLLQNALKFTHARTEVTLHGHAEDDRVLIDVSDHCGGLPSGSAETMFHSFTQRSHDRSGVGLGLSIAKRNVEADGGSLSVRDAPGQGCVFTISLPRRLPA